MSARSALTVVGQVVGGYLTAGSPYGIAIGGFIGPCIGSTYDAPEPCASVVLIEDSEAPMANDQAATS